MELNSIFALMVTIPLLSSLVTVTVNPNPGSCCGSIWCSWKLPSLCLTKYCVGFSETRITASCPDMIMMVGVLKTSQLVGSAAGSTLLNQKVGVDVSAASFVGQATNLASIWY